MINYVTGDATLPQGDGMKMIIHVCNDIGAWGAGFVMALSKRWDEPERYYREWFGPNKTWMFDGGFTDSIDPVLGSIQRVPVHDENNTNDYTFVYNMIAQRGLISKENPIPLDYDALEKCLNAVANSINEWKDHIPNSPFPPRPTPHKVSVHAPRFGAGLAGGDWNKIEALIQKCLVDKGVSVTIYDWQG